jgi:hypothetical protein
MARKFAAFGKKRIFKNLTWVDIRDCIRQKVALS